MTDIPKQFVRTSMLFMGTIALLVLLFLLTSQHTSGENATFGLKTNNTEDLEHDGFFETVVFQFDIDTDAGQDQEGWLKIDVINGSVLDSYSRYFNVTGNDSDPFDWSWSANFTGNYTFNIKLWNATNGTLLHEQNDTVYLEVVYEWAWRGGQKRRFTDLEEDSFTETYIFEFDIDTWDNYTQAGWLVFEVYNSSDNLTYTSGLSYSVTGSQEDWTYWEWSAPYTDQYFFEIYFYNETNETEFHNQDHYIRLDHPTDRANFSHEVNWTEDSHGDGSNDTAAFKFYFNTWHNHTQEGWLVVDIHNSLGYLESVNRTYNFTGNRTNVTDPIPFDWSAPSPDDYTFYFEFWNPANDTLFHQHQSTIYLEFLYEWAWRGSYKRTSLDLEEDTFKETISFEFDIDTWNNWTQRGWLIFEVFNGSDIMIHNSSVFYNVTGSEVDWVFWNWSAPYSDLFYFEIYMNNETKETEFHNQDHYLRLDHPTDRANFSHEMNWTRDLEEDDFNETAVYEFTFTTWNNHTQDGWMIVNIHNHTQYLESANTTFSFRTYKENGTNLSTTITFQWSAPASDNYTFYFEFWNPDNDTLFHSQNNSFKPLGLKIPIDMVHYIRDINWTEGREDDTFNETGVFEFELDTWNNFTQRGWLAVDIHDGSGYLESAFGSFSIRGNDTDAFIFVWSANVSDNYTFFFDFWNLANSTSLYEINHTIRLEMPYDRVILIYQQNRTEDQNEDLFNETASFEFEFDTWNNHTQRGWLIVEVHDRIQYLETIFREFSIRGNGTDPMAFEWSAGLDGNHTFFFELWNPTNDTLLHTQNHTILLGVPYPDAWFKDRSYQRLDGDDDTFLERARFIFDIDTWNNFTQPGWLVIEVSNTTGIIDTDELAYDVSGNVVDGVIWDWVASVSSDYNFRLRLFDQGQTVTFQDENLTISLETAIAVITLDTDTADDNDDGFNETAELTIDLETAIGHNLTGWVSIMVFQEGVPVDVAILGFDITGDGSDPLIWRWAATATANYTFEITVKDISNQSVLDTSQANIMLSVPYPDTWFTTLVGEPEDRNSDLHNETAVFDYNIDTWNGWDQEGLLIIEVFIDTRSTGRADDDRTRVYREVLSFSVTGAMVEPGSTWSWVAAHTGTYTFIFRLNSTDNTTFDLENRTMELQVLPPNQPPTAVLDASAKIVEEGDMLSLDASGSNDTDGDIVLYEWDFDGDGVYDAESTTPYISHQMNQKGTYIVRVRITDDRGGTQIGSFTVKVEEDESAGLFGSIIDSVPNDINDVCCWLPLLLLLLLILLLLLKLRQREPAVVKDMAPAPAATPLAIPPIPGPRSLCTDGRRMERGHLYFIDENKDIARIGITSDIDQVEGRTVISAKAGLVPEYHTLLYYVDADPDIILPQMSITDDRKYYHTGLVKEPGYLYFIDKNGDIARTRMARGKDKGGDREVVLTVGLVREPEYLYFIDKDGDISRTRRVIGGKDKVVFTGSKDTDTDTGGASAGSPFDAWKLYTTGMEMEPGRFYFIDRKGDIVTTRISMDRGREQEMMKQREVLIPARLEYEPGYLCLIYYQQKRKDAVMTRPKLPKQPKQSKQPQLSKQPEPRQTVTDTTPVSKPARSTMPAKPAKITIPAPKPARITMPAAKPTTIPMPTGSCLKEFDLEVEPGHFYYVDPEGHIARTKSAWKSKPDGDVEIVARTGIPRQPGHIYFVDEEGCIQSRTLIS